MRYTPYGRGDHGDDGKVTHNLSGYVLPQHKQRNEDNKTPDLTEIGTSYLHQPHHQHHQSGDSELKVKPEPRGPIKEHLKRYFTPLTTMTHHVAGSDGSCSPVSAGSPGGSDTVVLKNVKQEFEMQVRIYDDYWSI